MYYVDDKDANQGLYILLERMAKTISLICDIKTILRSTTTLKAFEYDEDWWCTRKLITLCYTYILLIINRYNSNYTVLELKLLTFHATIVTKF